MATNGLKRWFLFFIPSVGRAVIALGTLPLITIHLSAKDFGAFVLFSILASFFQVFPQVGTSVFLVRRYHDASPSLKKEIASSMLVLSILVGLVAAALAIGGWLILPNIMSLDLITLHPILMGLAWITIASSGWLTIASEIATLEGRASNFASIILARDISAAIATVISIFGFGARGDALFIGFVVGGLNGTALALFVMRYNLTAQFRMAWAKEILKEASILGSQLFEQGIAMFERSLIASKVSLDFLGIYGHSKTYEGLMMAISKALVRTSWGDIVSGWRKKDPATIEASDLVTGGISTLCLFACTFFATVGYDVVGLLSNQKFNDAATMAALWSVLIASRMTGIIPKVIVLTAGVSHGYSAAVISGLVAFSVTLFALQDHLNAWTLALAMAANTIVYKLVLYKVASRLERFPFQDKITFVVLAIGFGITFIADSFAASFAERLAFFVFFSCMTAIICLTTLKKSLEIIKTISGKSQ